MDPSVDSRDTSQPPASALHPTAPSPAVRTRALDATSTIPAGLPRRPSTATFSAGALLDTREQLPKHPLELDLSLDGTRTHTHFSSLPASPLDAPQAPLFPTIPPVAAAASATTPPIRTHDNRREPIPLTTSASAPSALVTSNVDKAKAPPAGGSTRSTTTPFTLWEYLQEELLATDFDSHQEMKWERVSNFLSVPVAVEKVRLVWRRAVFLWCTHFLAVSNELFIVSCHL